MYIRERLIAHRGNMYTDARYNVENNVSQINFVLSQGFNVEVDIRMDDSGNIYLGHDADTAVLTNDFFERLNQKFDGLLIHAKDVFTFHTFVEALYDWEVPFVKPDVFYNNNDKIALTVNGLLLVHPDYKHKFELSKISDLSNTIFVLDETQKDVARYFLRNTEAYVMCDYVKELALEFEEGTAI